MIINVNINSSQNTNESKRYADIEQEKPNTLQLLWGVIKYDKST